jgi:hypothetical protein
MTSQTSKAVPEPQHVRCFTRALKNARYLQTIAPDIFAKDPSAEGFGTGIPIEILMDLHRLPSDAPIMSRYEAVAGFLRENKLPLPRRNARDALFSGTVYFAQVTFRTSGGNLVIPTADMNMIVQYAQRAMIPILEYATQYGANTVSISPNLITYSANVPNASYSDSDLQGWVNDMANQNNLPSNSCIFVISPQGLTANGVGGNAGYHGLATIPYIVAGVFAQNLTLQDLPDVYAMVISHELAEMVVDPNVDGQNPEVCDPCDINCSNLTRIYFDASDNFLGMNQASPPSGFTFSYYICAVVKPEGASSCPAPATDCQYAPIPLDVGPVHYTAVWQPSTEGEIQVYGWTYQDYRAKYDELWPQGWRLKLLDVYVVDGQVRYTAVWQPSTEGEIQVYGWMYGIYRAKYDALWPQGWRLKLLDIYTI